MLNEAHEIEPYDKMRCRSARPLSQVVDNLLDAIRAFATAAKIHDRFEALTASGNGRIVPGVLVGSHVDHGPHLGVGITEHLVGTFFNEDVPLRLAVFVGGPFDRTVEHDAVMGGGAVSAIVIMS